MIEKKVLLLATIILFFLIFANGLFLPRFLRSPRWSGSNDDFSTPYGTVYIK